MKSKSDLGGFHRNLGLTSVTEAEISAIKVGLEVLEQFACRKVLIFTDSINAFNFLMRESSPDHPLCELILKTRHYLFSKLNVTLCYTSRDFIKCADFMAKQGHGQAFEITLVPFAPRDCVALVREYQRRLVRRNQRRGVSSPHG